MRKKFKGFTLVECLVALAILAIASLTMAQIYAAVSQRNKENHFMNTSLSNQMAFIESYTKSVTVGIYYDSKDPALVANAKDSAIPTPPHKQGIAASTYTKPYVQVDSSYKNETGAASSYSYSADVFIMYSRDTHNVGSNNKDKDGNTATYSPVFSEENNNLRYKYVLGHDNN